ncbi:hypothetical protein BGX31_011583 [Mortierella sp. GBA43]|nr:hypothetical protein BGX31_011583 [Mortierella sp. GBA43]
MDIALMTYQSPPQLWSSDHLRMMLHRYRHNPYQRLQIEQLLKQIKYRDTENHKSGIDKACNLVDSTPYHNGIHDSLGAEEATEEIHTNGRTHPVQYKGRPNYAMQEKMISAAASYASMVEAQRRAEQRPSVFNYILGKGDQFKVSTNTKDQDSLREDDLVEDEQGRLNGSEADEEEPIEFLEPSISVGSQEELEQVLKRLQEQGIRAEIVRGSITETI